MIQIEELSNDKSILQESLSGNRLFDQLRDLVLNIDISTLESVEGKKEFAINFARAIESTMRAKEVTFHQFQGMPNAIAGSGPAHDSTHCWSVYGLGSSGSKVESFQSVEMTDLRNESFKSNKAILRSNSENPDRKYFVIPFCGLQIFAGVFVCEVDCSDFKENLRLIASDVKSIKKILDIKVSHESQEFVNRQLAALIELTQKIDSARTVRSTSQTISNELQSYFDADFAAFATIRESRVSNLSLTHSSSLELQSKLRRNVQQLMLESALRGRVVSDSKSVGNASSIQLQQCRNHCQSEMIHCQPILDDDGTVSGAIVIGHSAQAFEKQKVQQTVSAFSSRLQHSVRLALRSKSNLVSRLFADTWGFFVNRKTIAFVFFLALFFTVLMIKTPYKVRCSGKLVGMDKRYIVAPIDGLLTGDIVEVGQQVDEGDTLAQIDASDLKIELSAKESERLKTKRERDVFLAAENIPEVVRANLMIKKLESEMALIQRKIDSTQLNAMSSGIVLSVDPKLGENSPIRKGEQLFEIVPLAKLELEIHIPSDEISKVEVGHSIQCVSPGNLFDPLSGQIDSIEPKSKLVDGENVFVARLSIDNDESVLKPGMDFLVTIECERATMGWNLFHKPIQWIDARFGW